MSVSPLQLNNKTLEYVYAVAKQKSFSSAAKSLYISQPALSKYIQHLEERIGSPLFYRVNNQIIPTYIGERFVAYAEQIIPLEREMEQELIDLQKGDSGRIRIALPHLWSSYLLPTIINSLKKEFSNLEIIIDEVTSSEKLEDMLLHHEVDLAIMREHSHNPKLSSTFLRHDEILLVLPHDHPLYQEAIVVPKKKYPVIDVALLKDLEFILQRPSQLIRQRVDDIFASANIEPHIEMLLRSIEASMKLVSGNRACFASETHVSNLDITPSPHYVSLNTPLSHMALCMFYLNTADRTKNLKQITHFLQIVMSQESYPMHME